MPYVTYLCIYLFMYLSENVDKSKNQKNYVSLRKD